MKQTVRLPVKHHTPASLFMARASRMALATLTIALAARCVSAGQATKPRSAADAAPALARIAGVRVGIDTLKTLRARLGPGTPMNGSRGYTWTWQAARCMIRATFDSPVAGTSDPERPIAFSDVVRCISLEAVPADAPAAKQDSATVHGYVRDLGWIGAVVPGMDRPKLMKAVSRLPKPETHGDEMIWRASAAEPTTDDPQAATRWAAVVQLKGGKVACIRVVAP